MVISWNGQYQGVPTYSTFCRQRPCCEWPPHYSHYKTFHITTLHMLQHASHATLYNYIPIGAHNFQANGCLPFAFQEKMNHDESMVRLPGLATGRLVQSGTLASQERFSLTGSSYVVLDVPVNCGILGMLLDSD